jgi:hypothetical protein
MSSKRRTISVADMPVKDAFTELEAFERDNIMGERTERRKELRENVLTALGLPPAVLEKDYVKRAFDCLYRECRVTTGDVEARVIKQRKKVAEVARAQAKKARTPDEHAAVAVLVALSGK